MVRALFAVAGCMQPAVIFVDEIDSILSARKSEGTCAWSVKICTGPVKSYLLIQSFLPRQTVLHAAVHG